MNDWREHANVGEWRLIEWEVLDERSQIELLGMLRQVVPTGERTNLMEKYERSDTINEALELAKQEAQKRQMGDAEARKHAENAGFAASILMNLEALHGEEIDWAHQADTFVKEVLAEKDVTGRSKDKPARELSRYAHAEMVVELLKEFQQTRKRALAQADDNEEAWLAEIVDQAASIGYWAGRRVQAAWGKPIEAVAVTGEGVLKGVRRGGEARKGKLGPDTPQILESMDALIQAGHSMSAAARITHKSRGLGASPNANQQCYKRHRSTNKVS